MRAIDANVLVRLITRDDPRQASSADRFIQTGAWVPLLALAEAIGVLSALYDRSAKELATAIDMLLNHTELRLQDPDVVEEALKVFRSRPALGFSDCLMLELARKRGYLPLGTFDRGLAKIAGAERL